jgi:hypothetical protein
MPKGLVTMSAREIDRGDLIRRVREKRLTQVKAAALIGLSVRQVKRLCRLFKDGGLSGLASRKRGRPSNGRLATEVKDQVVTLVRERYGDFGPKLAHEKLVELHGIRWSRGSHMPLRTRMRRMVSLPSAMPCNSRNFSRSSVGPSRRTACAPARRPRPLCSAGSCGCSDAHAGATRSQQRREAGRRRRAAPPAWRPDRAARQPSRATVAVPVPAESPPADRSPECSLPPARRPSNRRAYRGGTMPRHRKPDISTEPKPDI